MWLFLQLTHMIGGHHSNPTHIHDKYNGSFKIQPLNFLSPLHEQAGRLFCIKTADFLLSMGPETTDKNSK